MGKTIFGCKLLPCRGDGLIRYGDILTRRNIYQFLFEEAAPESAEPGTTAYRFTDKEWIFYGPKKSITVDETGAIVFVTADHYSGPLSGKQIGDELVESHITVVPGGAVADCLISQRLSR